MKRFSIASAFLITVGLTLLLSGCHPPASQINVNPSKKTISVGDSTSSLDARKAELMHQGAVATDPSNRIAFYRKAVQADPSDLANLFALAMALKGYGRNKEALAAFKQLGASDDPVWQNAAKTQTRGILRKRHFGS